MTVPSGSPPTARIRRVVGPLVEVDGAVGATMNNLVTLGDSAIPAETVSIRDGLLTVQAYEYTGGLRPGDLAVPQGRPLSAQLGPGLLGEALDAQHDLRADAKRRLQQEVERAAYRALGRVLHRHDGELRSAGLRLAKHLVDRGRGSRRPLSAAASGLLGRGLRRSGENEKCKCSQSVSEHQPNLARYFI